LALLFCALFVALCVTGLLSWKRSAPLRHGRASPRSAGGRWRTRSSRTTWLAAAAGAGTMGVCAASDWAALGRAAGAAAGGFVLVSGLAARVTGLSPRREGLVVRRAVLPDREARWTQVRKVIPPRWPLGAWRILCEGGVISLMPSDVLGAEAALAALVLGAGLWFDGRTWRRPPGR
jgi:hypothetical protein